MKDRLIEYPLAWASGASASAVSVFGVITQDNALAFAAALVSVSAVLSQPAFNMFKKYREAARTEDAKDREADLAAFAEEVRKRVELEAEVARLRAEGEKDRALVEQLQAELSQLRKATRAVNHKVEDVKAAVERVEKVQSADEIPTAKNNPG